MKIGFIFASYIYFLESFQSDTQPKVMAGYHFESKVIGQNLLHILSQRS